jgi:hypothetical protein
MFRMYRCDAFENDIYACYRAAQAVAFDPPTVEWQFQVFKAEVMSCEMDDDDFVINVELYCPVAPRRMKN